MKAGLYLRAALQQFEDPAIALALIERDADGVRVGFARAAIMERAPSDAFIAEPFARVTPEAARQLMDDLWAMGIRPTEFKHTDAAMAAQAAHLDDMRTIAFSKLEIAKP